MKKLYFGNLAYKTTSESLKSTVETVCPVISAIVIMDKMTNRSKGFGFVEVGSEEEMNNLINSFNGKDVDGREVVVNEARPLEDRPKREFRPRRDFGSSRPPRNNY